MNERTLEQLQIISRSGGRKTGLLTGREHEELVWIATTLRREHSGCKPVSPEAPPALTHDSKGSFFALIKG